MFEVSVYTAPSGKCIFENWLENLKDKKVRAAVTRRLNRVSEGNFGDHRYERDGVWELRIDLGPGYRVYYAINGDRVILLLSGGDKSTQARDLEKACLYWQQWKARAKK